MTTMYLGSMVKCVQRYATEKQYPEIRYPKLGIYYFVRDIEWIQEENKIAIRLWEIRNKDFIHTNGKIMEPTFQYEGYFREILTPLPPMNVDEVIRQCFEMK